MDQPVVPNARTVPTMTPAQPTPAAEVAVDDPLVRALLAEQHPDLAELSLRLVTNGWDNAVFRLGGDLAARLPRRALAAALVEHEQRWLPTLAPDLPLPVPAPVRRGVASPRHGYPWAWSVVPWFDGAVALDTPPADPAAAAAALGRFVAALHRPAPADAPRNPYRGIPLAGRDALVHDAVGRLDGLVDGDAAIRRWQELRATPPWSGPAVWVHGDLHPANVVVRDGRVAAVIDFGDLTAGDPATDLAIAWMLFPDDVDARAVFRDAVGVDADTWRRGEGWALALGLAVLAGSADRPAFTALGRRTVAAVVDP
jgi:aminoglycoside phosphotransferase (APT) family kinase protein